MRFGGLSLVKFGRFFNIRTVQTTQTVIEHSRTGEDRENKKLTNEL